MRVWCLVLGALFLVAGAVTGMDRYVDGVFVGSVARPKSVVVGGVRVLGPSTAQLAAAGYYETEYASVGEGLVATNWVRSGVVDGVSLYVAETVTAAVYSNQVAAAAAADLAQDVADHGAAVAQVGALLGSLGYSIPLTNAIEEVYAAGFAKGQTNVTLLANAIMLKIRYEELDAHGVGRERIREIAAVLGGGE